MANLATLLRAALPAAPTPRVNLRALAKTSRLSAASLLKAFNPDQPRDEKGRFGSTGGASKPSTEHGVNAATGSSAATDHYVLAALNPPHLDRLDEANAEKLTAMYQAAAAAKPEFDKALQDIAKDLDGTAQLPGLKGSDRATQKIVEEEGGDASNLRDVLRATVEVKTVQAAQEALAQLREKFEVLPRGFRNTLTPEAQTTDGYRDIKMNVKLSGLVAEIQVNVPGMLSAKAEMHVLYEERRTLMGKIATQAREPTADESKTIDKLDSTMRAGYDAAWSKILSS